MVPGSSSAVCTLEAGGKRQAHVKHGAAFIGSWTCVTSGPAPCAGAGLGHQTAASRSPDYNEWEGP